MPRATQRGLVRPFLNHLSSSSAMLSRLLSSQKMQFLEIQGSACPLERTACHPEMTSGTPRVTSMSIPNRSCKIKQAPVPLPLRFLLTQVAALRLSCWLTLTWFKQTVCIRWRLAFRLLTLSSTKTQASLIKNRCKCTSDKRSTPSNHSQTRNLSLVLVPRLAKLCLCLPWTTYCSWTLRTTLS